MKASTSSNTRIANQSQQQSQQELQKREISSVPREERHMTLSEAASIMRNANASPEERSLAASIMGREGGKHSHDHDREREEARRRKVAGG